MTTTAQCVWSTAAAATDVYLLYCIELVIIKSLLICKDSENAFTYIHIPIGLDGKQNKKTLTRENEREREKEM